jgi:hypothetical protein
MQGDFLLTDQNLIASSPDAQVQLVDADVIDKLIDSGMGAVQMDQKLSALLR